MSDALRVAVVGAGLMGSDHVRRLSQRIVGADVAVVVDVDLDRARKVAETAPGAGVAGTLTEALARGDVNAVVIATPGFLHQDALLQALEHNIPILCEKPLTPDAASSWKIVQAEQAYGRKRIQVGFMRRFDAEYQTLRGMFVSGEHGLPLMLHCQHRNPSSTPNFTSAMLINDSVVHEFDAIRYLTGEEIVSVQVRVGRLSRNAHPGQIDPQHVLIETASGILADVEIYVSARYGYEVATQAVFESAVVNIGGDGGAYVRSGGRWGGTVTPGFVERFKPAFDAEFQSWADAARRGEVGGPTAWDGYATAACCEAGVAALTGGGKAAVVLNEKPSLYL